MKVKYVIFPLSFLFIECHNTKEDEFLKKFEERKRFDFDIIVNSKKEINSNDLYLLTKSEANNEFVLNTDKKYYYGYRIKIKSNLFLLSYGVTYHPIYSPTNRIVNWFDSYLCLYKKNEGVVSKIKTESSDPILSMCHEKNGIYIVKSFFSTYRSEDTPENRLRFKRDSIISKYLIKNERFVEVK